MSRSYLDENTISKMDSNTLPPHTYYRYEYKDEYGIHFDIGEIKLLSK